MGRENCGMCLVVAGKMYCDYYDFAYMSCEELSDCPEHLDDDDQGEYDPDDDIGDWT